MIDIRLVRADPGAVRAALDRRGRGTGDVVDELLELDGESRELTRARDEARAEVKQLSQQVAAARRAGDGAKADELMARSRSLGDRSKELDVAADEAATALRDLLLRTPNLPSSEAPDGASEDDNRVVRVEGYDGREYGPHQRVPHWEIGTQLGILDVERATRMSGSMFAMLRRGGATLGRALCQLALDRNADAFEEIRPPTVVKTATMVSTGHLPKFEDEAYHVERDDLWLIPTAEVPLTSLAAGEVLDPAELPLRLMAQTACFRREAGAAGRDTRGLLRVHEFDKVEILAYATAAQAADMHAELLARAEGTLAALGLAYRVVDLCAGDLGASSARTFDLEVYAPGADMWLEASSVSWFSDYQARRAGIRYRGEGGTVVAHTLNGSALAVPRVWAAVVETYRLPDGSVTVPDVLRPYFRGAERIA
ncbi:MAG TPA: serine--tRNA ligase [Acidimicrobiales bacterium]|nr:serine--tRNA ligase [Acidimicrobiales bacterium]